MSLEIHPPDDDSDKSYAAIEKDFPHLSGGYYGDHCISCGFKDYHAAKEKGYQARYTLHEMNYHGPCDKGDCDS